jgi:soluble lytic murein transglycosylase-like protein
VGIALALALGLASGPIQAGDRIGVAALPEAVPKAPREAGLPQVLSAADIARYRRIFAAGGPGDWETADRLIARLDDDILVGHALAQRYLHPSEYWTPFKESRAWMARYADHPQAPKIHKLAVARRPAGGGPVQPPRYRHADLSKLGGGWVRRGYVSSRDRDAGERRAVRRVLAQVRRNVLRTRLSITEDYLDRPRVRRLLDDGERDTAHAQVAAAWLYYGRSDRAAALALPAARRSGAKVPQAQWIAGLAAWQQGDLESATHHFRRLADNAAARPETRAAGAYWTARALLRRERPAEVSRWLRRAAEQPRSFYGLIAHAALGIQPGLKFDGAESATARLRAQAARPAVRRAIALMQVGERDLARRELLGVDGWRDPQTAAALLTIAERGGLSAMALRLGTRLARDPDNGWPSATVNAALYPIPPWRPATGFRVDRALLYALMRRESAFDPEARSGAGARGLLQLMPATATYIARRENFRYRGRRELHRPDLNLDLAQRYIGYLSDYAFVDDNLIAIAAAYNGGPGNLLKWQKHTATEDPLLFIETLPARETRMFVERVLTNFWVYRHRLGQPIPSLQAIAAGRWPRYESLDTMSAKVARK